MEVKIINNILAYLGNNITIIDNEDTTVVPYNYELIKYRLMFHFINVTRYDSLIKDIKIIETSEVVNTKLMNAVQNIILQYIRQYMLVDNFIHKLVSKLITTKNNPYGEHVLNKCIDTMERHSALDIPLMEVLIKLKYARREYRNYIISISPNLFKNSLRMILNNAHNLGGKLTDNDGDFICYLINGINMEFVTEFGMEFPMIYDLALRNKCVRILNAAVPLLQFGHIYVHYRRNITLEDTILRKFLNGELGDIDDRYKPLNTLLHLFDIAEQKRKYDTLTVTEAEDTMPQIIKIVCNNRRKIDPHYIASFNKYWKTHGPFEKLCAELSKQSNYP